MKYHSVAIFVRDIEISRKFYREVLDRETEHDFGTNVILVGGISIWQIDDGHVISRKLETKGPSNRFELYFETEDIEAVDKRLKAHVVTCLHEMQEEAWGQRTIRFFDPDGHLIEIGESLKTFVTRMHRRGMSQREISEKSSIPPGQVRELLEG
jgi:catechol 2,3-dioxygenase-like lactoylglutathione lyase family enzyme